MSYSCWSMRYLSFTVAITLYPILNTLAVSLTVGCTSGGISLASCRSNYETVFNTNLVIGHKTPFSEPLYRQSCLWFRFAFLCFSIRSFFKARVVILRFDGMLRQRIPTFLLSRTSTYELFYGLHCPGIVSRFNLLVWGLIWARFRTASENRLRLTEQTIWLYFGKYMCRFVNRFLQRSRYSSPYITGAWFDNMIYNPKHEPTTLQYELMTSLFGYHSDIIEAHTEEAHRRNRTRSVRRHHRYLCRLLFCLSCGILLPVLRLAESKNRKVFSLVAIFSILTGYSISALLERKLRNG